MLLNFLKFFKIDFAMLCVNRLHVYQPNINSEISIPVILKAFA
jgi:hypothetical protein